MRGHDDVVELEQRSGIRLHAEDVQSGRRHLARAQRVGKRRLVDQLPPGRVDDPDAVLCAGQRLRVEQSARLVVQRHVQGEEVGGGENLVDRLGPGRAELSKALAGDEGVVADDFHTESLHLRYDGATDAAEANQADGFAGHSRRTSDRMRSGTGPCAVSSSDKSDRSRSCCSFSRSAAST